MFSSGDRREMACISTRAVNFIFILKNKGEENLCLSKGKKLFVSEKQRKTKKIKEKKEKRT